MRKVYSDCGLNELGYELVFQRHGQYCLCLFPFLGVFAVQLFDSSMTKDFFHKSSAPGV